MSKKYSLVTLEMIDDKKNVMPFDLFEKRVLEIHFAYQIIAERALNGHSMRYKYFEETNRKMRRVFEYYAFMKSHIDLAQSIDPFGLKDDELTYVEKSYYDDAIAVINAIGRQ